MLLLQRLQPRQYRLHRALSLIKSLTEMFHLVKQLSVRLRRYIGLHQRCSMSRESSVTCGETSIEASSPLSTPASGEVTWVTESYNSWELEILLRQDCPYAVDVFERLGQSQPATFNDTHQ